MKSGHIPFCDMVNPLAPNDSSWEIWEAVAVLAKDVDWGCDFQDGRCKKIRLEHEKYGPPRYNFLPILNNSHPGCCFCCCNEKGYLTRLPDNDVVQQVESMFDKKMLGFWRPGQGCVLPHKWRSATCLRFHCKSVWNCPPTWDAQFALDFSLSQDKTLRESKRAWEGFQRLFDLTSPTLQDVVDVRGALKNANLLKEST